MPLRRNRDFVLLETGRLLSTAGTASTTIAYPLLVLATTHSPAKAGVVAFARLVPNAVFGLVAGFAADRLNRRRLMITADGLRALAIASLAVTILLHRLASWQIPIVAFVEGSGSVFFSAAAAGALRSVVPSQQLPAAVGAQQARASTVRLAGPPLGGVLFALGRAIPFLVDSVSYAFSILSLLGMRTPFQQEREADTSPLRAQIAEGVRFLWSRPFLRTCALIYGLGNFAMPGLLLVIVVGGTRQGLSGGEIGLLVAVFGVSTLAGSLFSPLFRRWLSTRTIILIELWTWLGTVAFLVRPDVYVLTGAIVPFGIAAPVTDSVVDGYRIAVTPDRLIGRVESVRSSIALLVAPLGPLLAGFLLGSVSLRTTGAVFTACGIVLAIWGTLSPSIRNAPSLASLVHHHVTG
ncbi:MAG TPA: MFS transporter [Gaiellaceae bacterium]|nr:MFS transporter [Gaiellaceae bacterium]